MTATLAQGIGNVKRLIVFRALVLGDLLCAVPALRAFKQQWPAAELTFVGLPWARELCARLDCVDRFEEFPGFPGLPERTVDVAAIPSFFERMQRTRFDLAVQLHGSGNIVNQIVECMGATHVAGFHEPGGYAPDPALFTQWPEQGHEIERMLKVVDHLRIERCGTHLDFPLGADDRDGIAAIWPGLGGAGSYVCVHAGAQLPSRRWMPERFAQVANALADQGHTIVLTGTAGEAGIAQDIAARLAKAPVDLAGKTSLWTLGALVESAALVVSNDTGIMHVAAALGTPSVSVSMGADVSRWAPLNAEVHRVLWHDMPCRPCSFRSCPYDHGCATSVSADAVIEAATRALLSRRASSAQHFCDH